MGCLSLPWVGDKGRLTPPPTRPPTEELLGTLATPVSCPRLTIPNLAYSQLRRRYPALMLESNTHHSSRLGRNLPKATIGVYAGRDGKPISRRSRNSICWGRLCIYCCGKGVMWDLQCQTPLKYLGFVDVMISYHQINPK